MGREIRHRSFGTLDVTAVAAAGLAFAAGGGVLAIHFLTGVGTLLLGGLLSTIQPLMARRRRITSERMHALATLVELTHTFFDMDKECDLRVTLMQVNKARNPYRLEQLARCTREGRSHPSDTGMTIHQGVAGHCYRRTEGKVESMVVNLPPGDFVTQMVELGFEREEAQKLKPRGGYLCTPIIDSMKDVIAVLCIDRAESGAFKPEHAAMAERVTPFFTGFLTVPQGSGGENG